MANLAEAFEQHLRSLSDSDWDALVGRVRPPKASPEPGEPRWTAPGSGGRAEAERRFGPSSGGEAGPAEPTEKPRMGPSIAPSDHRPKSHGAHGRAEAEKRFGRTEQP